MKCWIDLDRLEEVIPQGIEPKELKMKTKKFRILVAYFGFLLIQCVNSSPGDRDPIYRSCVENCECTVNRNEASKHFLYPDWGCSNVCEYNCMHSSSAIRSKQGYPIMKYYGHWPFIRIYGMSEPASVVFSLLNAVPNAIYLVKHLFLWVIFPTQRKGADPISGKLRVLRFFLLSQSALSVIAWCTSAVFHTRKTDFTTALDYVSALMFLFSALWCAFYRVLGMYTLNAAVVGVVGILGLGCLLARIQLLLTRPIDFGAHMNICVGISTSQTCLWLFWTFFGINWETRFMNQSNSGSSSGASSSDQSKDSSPLVSLSHKYLCLGCQVLKWHASWCCNLL